MKKEIKLLPAITLYVVELTAAVTTAATISTAVTTLITIAAAPIFVYNRNNKNNKDSNNNPNKWKAQKNGFLVFSKVFLTYTRRKNAANTTLR